MSQKVTVDEEENGGATGDGYGSSEMIEDSTLPGGDDLLDDSVSNGTTRKLDQYQNYNP